MNSVLVYSEMISSKNVKVIPLSPMGVLAHRLCTLDVRSAPH